MVYNAHAFSYNFITMKSYIHILLQNEPHFCKLTLFTTVYKGFEVTDIIRHQNKNPGFIWAAFLYRKYFSVSCLLKTPFEIRFCFKRDCYL